MSKNLYLSAESLFLTSLLLTKLDLQFFADDPAPKSPEGGAEPNPDGQPPAKDNLDASDDQQKQQEEPSKTFTQAELDDIVAKRLERERKKFADYDDLKTKATEYEQKQEEQRLAALTETERAQELAKQHEEKIAELQKQLSEKDERANKRLIKAEFIKFAEKAGIVDVEAALVLSDLSTVQVDEHDNVDGVEALVKSLVESKPYLVSKQQKPIGQPSNPGAEKYHDKPADQRLAEAYEKARRTGNTKDRVAYARLKRELGK